MSLDRDKQMEEVLRVVAELPQLDVPEQVTQQIMRTVDQEKKHSWLFTQQELVVPLALGCVAVSMTLQPFDNFEGMASIVVGLGALFILNLFIKAAQLEDVQQL